MPSNEFDDDLDSGSISLTMQIYYKLTYTCFRRRFI